MHPSIAHIVTEQKPSTHSLLLCRCIIVDSTRKGKRVPDALSKTIPIWCATINNAVQKRALQNQARQHGQTLREKGFSREQGDVADTAAAAAAAPENHNHLVQ